MTEQEKYKLSTYRTIKMLHATDTSQVELAECTMDGNIYIKKTYPSDKREVFSILSEIHNPHLPRIKEIFFHSDTVVIEEFIDGTTLLQLLETQHPFSKAEIHTIVDGLLEAICTLHSHKLIHRDIKPENIIIQPNGQAVLIDYNIARNISGQRNDTELLGTVGYAAPEQFGFSATDARTDLYALGITLKQIANKTNAPKHLLSAIEKCTEFDPSHRFQTAEGLHRWLKQRQLLRRLLPTAASVLLFLGLFALLPQTSSSSELTPLLYAPDSTRLVDTFSSTQEVPCLPLPEDGTYETEIELSIGTVTSITAVREQDSCRVTIQDGPTFTFEDDHTLSTASYPNGDTYMEILFYDMNNDGQLEILPVISNALRADWPDGSVSLMKNYTLAWCVYYDGAAYQCDQTQMTSKQTFHIDTFSPGQLWTDFINYYTLKNDTLIYK